MAMLSPGVEVLEIDASGIVPTVSNSIAVFGGSFAKGPAAIYKLVTNSVELEGFYGKPTTANYNDWYQCKTFLDYGNLLLVSRGLSATASNSIFFAQAETQTVEIPASTVQALVSNSIIPNETVYETLEGSIQFPTDTTVAASIKIMAKNPGSWGDEIAVAIAKPSDFSILTPKYAFSGISLNDQFDYFPQPANNSVSGYYEYAILVQYKGEVVERFIVSFNEDARDSSNKTIYIESLINSQSKYIFVKENKTITAALADENKCKSYLYSNTVDAFKDSNLSYGDDGVALTNGEITNAYDIFLNKEEIDIDIVIGNEQNPLAAINLAEGRKDCIAFVGAKYGDTVGKTASDAVSALITWRTTGEMAVNSSYVVAGANYINVYDKYSDRYKWINVAGTLAGLRAATNTSLASWWASAGLERGQLKNVTKLAFNPNQGQRDFIYKNGMNPIVAFPGQGTVLWGQKTLLDKPSSFDRVNVRGLFITLERALWKMAKYQVFEFNDSFTRNRISAMINPFLSTVQSGRGIEDFLVVCDTTNNTPDIVSRNQLVVDVFIKPTYVAEFIQLRFTNAGTNSFASIVGA